MIDPMYFYIISVVSTLRCVAFCLTFLTPIAVGAMFAVMEDETEEELRRYVKWGISLSITCLILVIVLPSETVCYQMLVAHYLTNDVLKDGLQFIQETVATILKTIG